MDKISELINLLNTTYFFGGMFFTAVFMVWIIRSEFGKTLCLDPDGKISHSKLWANVAYFVATIGMIVNFSSSEPSAELFLIYLGVVATNQVASKFLTLKFGGGKE